MPVCVRTILQMKGYCVETVDPNSSVLDAVQRMNEQHIGSLVVTQDGNLVGIVTERDLLARVLADRRDPVKTRVREVMTPDPVIIDADTTVDEAIAIVSEKRCRHLPVLQKGALYGVLSVGDLTAWIVRDQRRTIEDLYDYMR